MSPENPPSRPEVTTKLEESQKELLEIASLDDDLENAEKQDPKALEELFDKQREAIDESLQGILDTLNEAELYLYEMTDEERELFFEVADGVHDLYRDKRKDTNLKLDNKPGNEERDEYDKSHKQRWEEAMTYGKEALSYDKELSRTKTLVLYLSREEYYLKNNTEIIKDYPEECIEIAHYDSSILAKFKNRDRDREYEAKDIYEAFVRDTKYFMEIVRNTGDEASEIFEYLARNHTIDSEHIKLAAKLSKEFDERTIGVVGYYATALDPVMPKEKKALKKIFKKRATENLEIGIALATVQLTFRSQPEIFIKIVELFNYKAGEFTENFKDLPPEKKLKILSIFQDEEKLEKVKTLIGKIEEWNAASIISTIGLPTEKEEKALQEIYENTKDSNDGIFVFSELMFKFSSEFRKDPEFFATVAKHVKGSFRSILFTIDTFKRREKGLKPAQKDMILEITKQEGLYANNLLEIIGSCTNLFKFKDFLIETYEQLPYDSEELLYFCNHLPHPNLPEMTAHREKHKKGEKQFIHKIYELSESNSSNADYFKKEVRAPENLELLPPEAVEKIFREAGEIIHKSTDEKEIQEISYLLRNTLTYKNIPLKIKKRTLQIFEDYLLAPDKFKFTENVHSELKIDMIKDFSLTLLKNLTKPEFKDIRDEKLEKLSDFAKKTLTESINEREIQEINDLLQEVLTDKNIPLNIKKRTLQIFEDYLFTPDKFKFTKTTPPEFKMVMSNAFSFGLLRNLTKPEFKDIRDEKLKKLLDFAEKVLASTDTNPNEYTRAKFIAQTAFSLFSKTDLPEDLSNRINQLNQAPTGPETSLFEDNKIIAKLYFQEKMKEVIWKRMYINKRFGYRLTGYGLNPVFNDKKEDFSEEDFKKWAKKESRKKGDYTRKGKNYMKDLVKKGYTEANGVKISLKECVRIANELKNKKDIPMSHGKTRKTAHLLRQIGIFDDEVWKRRWKEKGTIREQIILIPRAPQSHGNFDRSVFEGLTKDHKGNQVDYVLYNGHAGGGTGLDRSFEESSHYYDSPIIQLANCWSKTEMPRVQKYFPNAHPIVTKIAAMSGDGALIFGSMMEEMKKKWSNIRYKDVRTAIKRNKYGILTSSQTKTYHEDKVGNRIFPDEAEMQNLIDSDRDGTPDYMDDTYNFTYERAWRNDYEFQYGRPKSSELLVAPREKAQRSIGYIARLFEDDPFLAKFSYKEENFGNGYPKFVLDEEQSRDSGNKSGGFFISRTDSAELLHFHETTDRIETNDGNVIEEPIIQVSLNLGYADLNLNTIQAKVFAEAAKYASEKHFDLSKKVFDEEVLFELDRVSSPEAIKKLELRKIPPKKIFEAFGVEGDEQVKLVNRVRNLITSLKYWKRTWETNAGNIQTAGETPELLAERDGLKQIFQDTMQNNNFSVEISEDEMHNILKISENPYLWFLRLVIKKNQE